MKVTESFLKAQVGMLNRLMGNPPEAWKIIDGKNMAQVGNIHLEKGFKGWTARRITNENGGCEQFPTSYSGLSKWELCVALDAALRVLELKK